MAYDVIRTEKADNQIKDLIYYIAEDSGNAEIALSYLDKLKHAIGLLREQPYYGAESRNYSLKKMKFRVLPVENHLVFYKVRERDQTVIIYAVADYRRDYINLIF